MVLAFFKGTPAYLRREGHKTLYDFRYYSCTFLYILFMTRFVKISLRPRHARAVLKYTRLQYFRIFWISKNIKIALLVKSYGNFSERSEFFLLDKVVKLVGGGSVINGAYPV